jgi:hypothetical protein
MPAPAQVTWEPNGDTWELQCLNNGPDDIHDVTVVKVPGGPQGDYPPTLAVGERHTYRIVSVDPGTVSATPDQHYVIYYNVGTNRYSCDNNTGTVIGPL